MLVLASLAGAGWEEVDMDKGRLVGLRRERARRRDLRNMALSWGLGTVRRLISDVEV